MRNGSEMIFIMALMQFGMMHAADVCTVSKTEYQIPELHFGERADWINVKTDEGAKGDGKSDDTTAIQRALDQIQDNIEANGTKTVFFPSGSDAIESLGHQQ